MTCPLASLLARAADLMPTPFIDTRAFCVPVLKTYNEPQKISSGAFAPRTSLGLFVRNLVIAATVIPGLARLAFGRDLSRIAQLDGPTDALPDQLH